MRAIFGLMLTGFFLLQVAATDRMQATVQSVEVPAGERLLLKAHGEGVQIYRCDKQGDGAAWVFVAPEAKLFVKGVEEGAHGAGPVWHDRDGSSVWGEVLAKAPSSNADAIPLLLLKAVKTQGTGILSGVNYIQRADTRGGNASASGCDAAHEGAESRVPYSAEYLFYAEQK
jgi:hypothetical protein